MNSVVLISGNGSNLQALIDMSACINLDIKCVISNKGNAFGLKRAHRANIKIKVLKEENLSSQEFDEKLIEIIDDNGAQLIILAGFIHILTPLFIHHYKAKILNIHPSLLPKFKGLNTHKRVILSGDLEHGASVHFVSEILDSGAVVAQSVVPIFRQDTSNLLAERVLHEEHKLYPKVISWYTSGRLSLIEDNVYLDGKMLKKPIIFTK